MTTRSEELGEISRELETLDRLVQEKKYDPLSALDEILGKYKDLIEAAQETDPDVVLAGIDGIREWFERAVDLIRETEETQQELQRFQVEWEKIKAEPLGEDPKSILRRQRNLVRVEKESLRPHNRSAYLERGLSEIQTETDRILAISAALDEFFSKATEAKREVRRARVKRLVILASFTIAALCVAILVGAAVDFLYTSLAGRPFSKYSLLITTTTAFLIETLFLGRLFERTKNLLVWDLYGRIARELREDIAETYSLISEVESLVERYIIDSLPESPPNNSLKRTPTAERLAPLSPIALGSGRPQDHRSVRL